MPQRCTHLALLWCAALVSMCAAGIDGVATVCEHSANTSLFAQRGPCPAGSSSVRVAGVNIFDQLWVGSTHMSTCCNATGGPATYPDALAALESAAGSGVRVFRVFASLFGANQKHWVTDAQTFWSEFDRLLDDIERLGMHAILSLGTGSWHEVANALTPGLEETLNDGVKNTSSVAFQLQVEPVPITSTPARTHATSASHPLDAQRLTPDARQTRYFREVVTRYAARPAVLLWELGNELNLEVNLPPRTKGSAPNFNTAEMVAHTGLLVAGIRALDPRRPISSG